MASAAADAAKFKVLVVSSDSDTEFADRLVRGLTAQHEFDASVAPQSQTDDEDANTRIVELIEGADTIVFAISTEAIETRAWVLEHSSSLSKRIIPVTCRTLRRTPVARAAA